MIAHKALALLRHTARSFTRHLKTLGGALAIVFVGMAASPVAAQSTFPSQTQGAYPAPAQSASTENAQSAYPAPAQSAYPAMWRVVDADSEIFLFGAMHVLPEGLNWTSPAFDAAMEKAPLTYVEADVKSAAALEMMRSAIAAHGFNPPGQTLSQILGKKRARELDKLSDQTGVPLSALEPMRPWLALITLSHQLLLKEGFDPSAGVETAILSQAGAEADEIAFLESAAFQIEMLASLDDAAIGANFDTSVDQFKEFQAVTQRMLAAWREGDLKALEKEVITPLQEEAPGAYEALFRKRNANWTAHIAELMAGDGAIFIAVGAGHLVGDDSVIDMLREAGFTVERVQ